MDGVAAIRNYIDRMLDSASLEKTRGGGGSSSSSGSNGGGNMKAFLLDAVTKQIVSAVYSQTEILQKQVYLVTRIDETKQQSQSSSLQDQQQDVGHLTALCFCRPTPANIDHLGRELSLSPPRFKEYHVYFTGVLTTGLLRVLAEHDRYERIASVQEYYADFVPINNDLWTLQSAQSLVLTTAAGTSWAPKYASHYERNLQGLQSMLLALKRQPSCIRYAGQSACAEELAKDLHDAIVADDIFHFHRATPSSHGNVAAGLVVLVLDRRDDPVTPLLSQWTYQAMVHELLGLNNHRVVLRGAPNIDDKDLEEVVLSAAQDAFFKKHCHSNFGELGEAIQQLLKDWQKQSAQHSSATQNFSSVEEMQAFMEKFPEIRSQSHTVSKHVAIMGELARLVETCSLLDVSELEQELATTAEDHNTHWRQLMQKLSSPTIKVPDKLRLGLLYALRYETLGNLHMVQSAMSKGGVPQDMVNLLPIVLRYGGIKSRGPGLYGDNDHHTNKGPGNVVTKMTKSFMSNVVLQGGVENVYAQHVPLVMETVQALVKGKLSTRTHPIVPGSWVGGGRGGTSGNSHHGSSSSGSSGESWASSMIPSEVLIFMVGGITYEEGTKIHEFNQQQQQSQHGIASSTGGGGGGMRQHVVLAGSTVHNSTSFLDELKATSL